MAQKVVGVIVGSLRKDSYNRKIADFIIKNAPAGFTFKLINIADLPLYNQDYDEASPAAYTKFREEVKAVDAVLFVTPEHNRSVPAALKNALDVASRPYGANVWSDKPGGVISVSIGAIGGFGANHHLRQTLSFLNVLTLQQPEAYVGGISDADFDQSGNLTNERTAKFIKSYIDAFVKWIDRLA